MIASEPTVLPTCPVSPISNDPMWEFVGENANSQVANRLALGFVLRLGPGDRRGSFLMLDFYSDTKTKPTRKMREAVLDAVVGDEQKGEDPTTNKLCERVAELLGKEAAVFLPSGSMCNEIAIAIHCRPGDEVLCDRPCHILNFEGGGPAALSGVILATLAF